MAETGEGRQAQKTAAALRIPARRKRPGVAIRSGRETGGSEAGGVRAAGVRMRAWALSSFAETEWQSGRMKMASARAFGIYSIIFLFWT
jgi:hypothetical protein